MQKKKSVFYSSCSNTGNSTTMTDLFDSIVFKDPQDYATESVCGITFLATDAQCIAGTVYSVNDPRAVQPSQLPTLAARLSGTDYEATTTNTPVYGKGLSITPKVITTSSKDHRTYVVENLVNVVSANSDITIVNSGDYLETYTLTFNQGLLGKVRLEDANSDLYYLGDRLGHGLEIFDNYLSVKYQDGIATNFSADASGLKVDLLYNPAHFQINGSNQLEAISFSDVVYTTGTQTITGAKTFSTVVIGITPTLSTHLATKGYIDTLIASYSTTAQVNTLLSSYSTTTQMNSAIAAGLLTTDYDTGWINLTGFSYLSGSRRPQYRVINRLIMFRGDVTIPIDNGSHALEANITDYKTLVKTLPLSFGTEGVLYSTTEQMFFNYDQPADQVYKVISNTNRLPTYDIFHNAIAKRSLVSANDATVFLDYTAPITISISNAGYLSILTNKYFEITNNGFIAGPESYPLRAITSNVRAGKYNLDYSASFTDAEGGGTINITTITKGARTHSANINGNGCATLGGFVFSLDGMTAVISDAISLATIHA